MKIKIILLLSIMFTTFSFSQTATDNPQPISKEVSLNKPIPFQLVEVPPLAPDCKAKWKVAKQFTCTSRFISDHVNRKFNTELVSELGLTDGFKIEVTFTIDKEGSPKNITATGGPDLMNQHAIEVIQKLPQLSPAMHNGEVVEVSYWLPIVFDIR